jgi:uncharacterized cupredoxin-like copper-binding protein
VACRADTIAAAMRRTLASAVLGLTLIVPIAACGGGESGSAVPANPDLSVIGEDIKFDQKTYDVGQAGPIEIAYRNEGQQVHSMVFEDANKQKIPGFRLQVSPGKAVGGEIDLAAGTYTMICDIPGHEAAGMVAQVTIG